MKALTRIGCWIAVIINWVFWLGLVGLLLTCIGNWAWEVATEYTLLEHLRNLVAVCVLTTCAIWFSTIKDRARTWLHDDTSERKHNRKRKAHKTRLRRGMREFPRD